MKPARFRYARPGTLDQTVSLLATHGGRAKLLAGGQSLLPLLNMRLARPEVLIDITLVPELQVLAREDGALVLGAGVRQRSVETSDVVRQACPLLPLALRWVGHLQTRTRGTVGGSLAYADPRAELPAVAVALDASLVAVGPRGRRVIPAEGFFLGPYATALAEDEVLTEVRLPVHDGTRCAFVEVTPRSGGVAIVGVAAELGFASGGTVERARLVATGVSGAPLRLRRAEEAARGTDLRPEERDRIGLTAVEEAERQGPGGRPDAYRRQVLGTLVARALAEMAAEEAA